MKFIVKPYVGIGSISLGKTRAQVREAVAAPVNSFLRNEDDEAETDEFESLGLYVEYDKNDVCIAFEMFSPAEPIFMDKDLLRTPYAVLRDWIKSLDRNVEIDDAGLVSNSLGIGFSANIKKIDKKSCAESAIVFKRSYYDE